MQENKTDNAPKSYKTQLIIFISVVAVFFALGWALPIILNMRESIVERYLLGAFAAFLVVFLLKLK